MPYFDNYRSPDGGGGGGGGTGDITAVTAGNGLTGGGVTGDVALAILAENTSVSVGGSGLSVNLANAFAWTAAHTFNTGTSQGTPILLDMAQPGIAGQRDSHVLQFRGTSFDSSGHNADWRMFADVTSNAAASTFTLQTRVDAGGFASKLTLTDAGALAVTSLTASSLTSGRVPFATTAGLLTDAATLAFNSGTGVLSVTGLAASGLTSGRVTFATTAGLLTDASTLTFNSGTGALTATSLVLGGKITGLTQGTASGEALSAARAVNTSTGLSGGGALTGDLTLTVNQATAFAWTSAHTLTVDDAGTNTTTDLITYSHTSSGTAAASFGAGALWKLENAGGTNTNALRASVVWNTATASSETAEYRLFPITAGSLPTTAAFALNGTTGQTLFLTDAATATVTDLLTLDHRSSGTAASGYGTGILFRGQDGSATAGGDDLGRISATMTTVTSGAEVSAMQLQTRTAGGALATALTITNALVSAPLLLTGATIGVAGNNYNITTASNLITHTLANSRFGHSYSRTAPGSGSDRFFNYTTGNSTGRTASTEIIEFNYAIGNKQWLAGAITTQREVAYSAPTYSFASASTITNAALIAIAGAPIAGTNATLTNSYALWVQADTTRLDGLLDLSGIAAGSPNIKITATSDTPTVAFTDSGAANHAPTTAPAGYIEINVGGSSRYIPFWA
jgi:hypothetical protein